MIGVEYPMDRPYKRGAAAGWEQF